ncbi:hypothetical protein [Flagellimonas zhangzhouensis]|nr:hypothetical protein [Allomuricauda zhangzhouensis]
MKKILFASIIFLTINFFSQKSDDCDDRTVAYWWNGTNSRIAGEVPTLKKTFGKIQQSETEIEPKNGFITMRLNISKTSKLCDIQTFQIDKNYKKTEFNNGQLALELEKIALGLNDWKKDKNYKTYNLIRLKIQNGKIEEIF